LSTFIAHRIRTLKKFSCGRDLVLKIGLNNSRLHTCTYDGLTEMVCYIIFRSAIVPVKCCKSVDKRKHRRIYSVHCSTGIIWRGANNFCIAFIFARLKSLSLRRNSITLSGSKLVTDRFEPDNVMEFGFYAALMDPEM